MHRVQLVSMKIAFEPENLSTTTRHEDSTLNNTSLPPTRLVETGNGKAPSPRQPTERPRVFDFVDYREYMKAYYEHRKATHPHWSMSAFARKAGFGESSRGYLRLIMDGKRNLSTHTLTRLISAMSLDRREGAYFETLVHYNQARSQADRQFYFQRLEEQVSNVRSAPFDLLRSQVNYCSKWYYVAIRELAAFDDFSTEPTWIAPRLRAKVSPNEIQHAISDLVSMGLLSQTSDGRVRQSQPVITLTEDFGTHMMTSILSKMLDLAKDAIENDPSDSTSMSCATLSVPYSAYEEVDNEIRRFRQHLLSTYGNYTKKIDSVIQINFQLFQLTPPRSKSVLEDSKE